MWELKATNKHSLLTKRRLGVQCRAAYPVLCVFSCSSWVCFGRHMLSWNERHGHTICTHTLGYLLRSTQRQELLRVFSVDYPHSPVTVLTGGAKCMCESVFTGGKVSQSQTISAKAGHTLWQSLWGEAPADGTTMVSLCCPGFCKRPLLHLTAY